MLQTFSVNWERNYHGRQPKSCIGGEVFLDGKYCGGKVLEQGDTIAFVGRVLGKATTRRFQFASLELTGMRACIDIFITTAD